MRESRDAADPRARPAARLRRRALDRRRGYGYLTTRDGTKLAIDVHLPSGPGPYPALVEYSGYGYANPDGAESSIGAIANLLGYAVVDVNMRGTGCSGGAFDYFETLQGLDGYDVIETVARQPWAARHEAGMVGLSYGGMSQLFVAATRPPSLSAITPLSVIDFLELYVAHRRPQLPPGVRDAAPLVFKTAMGVDGVTLPDDPIQAQPTYEAAEAARPGDGDGLARALAPVAAAAAGGRRDRRADRPAALPRAPGRAVPALRGLS